MDYSWLLLNLGLFGEAIEQLQESYETEKAKRADIYAMLGLIYSKIKNCQKAAYYLYRSDEQLKTLEPEIKSIISENIKLLKQEIKNICE